MGSIRAPQRPFALIGSDHPFAAHVSAFADMIAEHCGALDAPEALHTEIKALPERDGSWRLDRFYWSGQRWGGDGPARFMAQTLSFRDGQGAAWHRFPHDPYLGDLSAAFAALQGRDAAQIRVLRYVPLRRLTFRLDRAQAPSLVGKFKRRSRFRDADDRLEAVALACAGRAVGFRVAQTAGVDEALGLTLQEAIAGEALPDLIDLASAPALLARLGETHRALHELRVPGVPEWDPDAFRAGTARDLRWIAFMRPELADGMLQIARLIDATAPDLGRAGWAFCHGDFVPSQILVADGPWGVIDFDLCRVGDPYQELAMLLAALPYDVPALRTAAPRDLARASAAYLAGYADRAGAPIDQARLRWHRLCAEVYYLALALKKDWLDLAGMRAAVARLCDAADDLHGGGRL